MAFPADISVTIINGKIAPTISTIPTTSNITDAQTLSNSTLSGGVAIDPTTGSDISGTFTFTNPSSTLSFIDDLQDVDVTFTPDDVSTYSIVTGITTSINILSSALTLSNDLTTVIGYNGTPVDIIIPSSVTDINESVFKNCSSLVSVTINGTECTIHNNAFQNCTNLTTLNISRDNSPVNVGNYAFENCSKFANITCSNADFRGMFGSIGNYAFANCTNLVAFPISVFASTTIGNYTFSNCTKLSYCNTEGIFDIQSGVTSIGNNAFENCPSLLNLSYYSSTSVGSNMFLNNNTNVIIIDDPSLTKQDTYVVTSPTASSITDNDPLRNSTLTGGSGIGKFDGSIAGTFSFTNPNLVLAGGDQAVACTFTPNDLNTYNISFCTVHITVTSTSSTTTTTTTAPPATTTSTTTTTTTRAPKTTPTILSQPTASSITNIEQLSNSVLSGGSASVPGRFTFTNPTSVLPTGNGQSVSITFIPSDSNNYNNVTSTTTINVTSIVLNQDTTITTTIASKPVVFTATSTAPVSNTVTYAPTGTNLPSVTVTALPPTVSTMTIAVSPPVNNTVALIVNAYANDGGSLHNFASSPLTLQVTIPGITTPTATVNTYDTNTGTLTDTVQATLISAPSTYQFTLNHLTTIVVTANTTVPCFPKGTRIATASGYVPVETLTAGDLVLTSDNRQVPVKVYSRTLRATEQTAPYLIPKNSLGPSQPAADLRLSPLHAFQLKKGLWQIPQYASKLSNKIAQYDIGSTVTYYHLECPNFFTDNLLVDGCVVESFGANQISNIKTLYKYNANRKGFTRASASSKTLSL
uniref:Hedgehog/Intein (Hint) domain-containing protein n=1 Tax=viral metagenome TaxID=1070528 RepID=A0A6C0APZ5_9ZZZZ